MDPPLGILLHVQDHEHFIPAKFHKHPLSSSVVKADYVFPYIYVYMHLCNPPPSFLDLNKYIKNVKHGNYTK